MFYCDYCRVQQEYPQSTGWPYMGISHGACELCGTVTYCHDMKLNRGGKKILRLLECGGCGEHRYGRRDDYLCTFCRGEHVRPNPVEEIQEATREIDEITQSMRNGDPDGLERMKEYFAKRMEEVMKSLDNLP